MNNTIFITGASSGIGQATALYFAKKGWNVIATMRNPEKQTVLKNSQNVLVSKLDVEEPLTFPKIIQESIKHFGKIDVLLNNAGYGQHGLFEATTPEQIQKQFSVNLFGAMEVTRAILPHFRKNQAGTIITITSGVGRVTTPLVSVYAASKFALEGFFESLSFELASQKIMIKIIEPGSIDTNFEQTTKQHFAIDDKLVDYDSYLRHTDKVFKSIYSGGSSSAEDVAKTIYEAATDKKNQLRYVIGYDLKAFLKIRNHNEDEDYMKALREVFAE
ncbi:SDR family oxidoreductase [Tenacibaculum sp. ZH5_bin.1]|uniref:SDR family oxidoreductase n=1 Tax=Tenacibaculum TaxID=104267 RepID=UPI00142F8E35|nr:SDR family oxidoreductase [Tenacibaculum mesophilum]KAF9658495.1 SDR family oxidoreductase [Tenacibaculum mesophilum]